MKIHKINGEVINVKIKPIKQDNHRIEDLMWKIVGIEPPQRKGRMFGHKSELPIACHPTKLSTGDNETCLE